MLGLVLVAGCHPQPATPSDAPDAPAPATRSDERVVAAQEPAAETTHAPAARRIVCEELAEATARYREGGKAQLQQAEELLDRCLAADPRNADALLIKAQVALELDRPEESLRIAMSCVEIAPGQADCWLTIGVLSDSNGDKTRAINAYRRYVELAPEGTYVEQVEQRLYRLAP